MKSLRKSYAPLFIAVFAAFSTATMAGPMMQPGKTMRETPPPPQQEREAGELVTTLQSEYTFESDFDDAEKGEGPAVWASKYTYLRRIPKGKPNWYYRVGLNYSYWDISGTDAPLPDTLQSVVLPLGLEWKEDKFFKFLFQVNPGFYFGNDLDWDDFDIPTTAIYGFDLTDDFRLYVGAVGSLFSKYGVLPVGGFVWEPQRWLILSATFPEAGVFLSFHEDWTIFLGGEFQTGSFRVDREGDFPPALKEAVLDYDEIRVGGHVIWRFADWGELNAGGGYAVYRDWEYDRAGVEFEQEGAPYAKAALKLKF